MREVSDIKNQRVPLFHRGSEVLIHRRFIEYQEVLFFLKAKGVSNVFFHRTPLGILSQNTRMVFFHRRHDIFTEEERGTFPQKIRGCHKLPEGFFWRILQGSSSIEDLKFQSIRSIILKYFFTKNLISSVIEDRKVFCHRRREWSSFKKTSGVVFLTENQRGLLLQKT